MKLQHVYPVPNHARIVRTAPGGTWCGSPRKRVTVENRTACGAPCTGHDVFPTSAGKIARNAAEALVCRACREWLGLPVDPGAIGKAAGIVAAIQRSNDERNHADDLELRERVARAV